MSDLKMSHNDTIYEIPMIQIMLMMRQKVYQTNSSIMTLQDKEMIDKGII